MMTTNFNSNKTTYVMIFNKMVDGAMSEVQNDVEFIHTNNGKWLISEM